jgi:Tfp pilus assembly protein PilX
VEVSIDGERRIPMSRRVVAGSKGVALMLVLVIITLLVIITTAFSKTMMSSHMTARDNESSTLSFYVADSALQLAMERIATGNARSFNCDDGTVRIIRLGDLADHPDLIGEATVVIQPEVVGSSSSTHVIQSTGEIKKVRPGAPDELVARRILVAEVTYTLLHPTGPNPRGQVQLSHWFEQNR